MSAGHQEIRTERPSRRPAENRPWAQELNTAMSETLFPPLRQTSRQVGPEWDEDDSPTLLSLVEAVGEVTEDDREVVAAVSHMLHSGRVHFRGGFRQQRGRSRISHA